MTVEGVPEEMCAVGKEAGEKLPGAHLLFFVPNVYAPFFSLLNILSPTLNPFAADDLDCTPTFQG